MTPVNAQVATHPDPSRAMHLGIRRDEPADAFRRFFCWEVPALAREKQRAIAGPDGDAGPSMTLESIGDFAADEPLEVEDGLAFDEEGGLCVAVRTEFPHSTPDMFDWWMGWHIQSTERYKLWHPQAHLRPATPSRQRHRRPDGQGALHCQRVVGRRVHTARRIPPGDPLRGACVDWRIGRDAGSPRERCCCGG